MARAIFVVATLDTKGPEAVYVVKALHTLGVAATLIDTSTRGSSIISRADATHAASAQLRAALLNAHAAGTLAGVLALGGSVGTQIATSAMQALPMGVPKLMVSTMASGQVRSYVGNKDIIMMNPVVDISGLNRITRQVLWRAACAMAGMCKHPMDATPSSKPLVTATMFGITTACVNRARELLEAAGCEVMIFSANGLGGSTMESLISEGLVQGVLDITTTEIADEIAGGTLSAGAKRLTAAAAAAIPQVVSVGATDVVNFGPKGTVPKHLLSRRLLEHNDSVTLMRTSPTDNARIGVDIGTKLRNSATTTVLLPLLGVSALDKEGAPFADTESRRQLFEKIEDNLGSTQTIRLPCHINDPAFAERAVVELLRLMNGRHQ